MAQEGCGFHFPPIAQVAIGAPFLDRLFKLVHKLIFKDKKKLSIEERKSFIDLVYLLLQIKIIEAVSPTTFSLSCKDAIDDGAASSALLYCFIYLMQGKKMARCRAMLDRLIFDIPMMIRERVMIEDDFVRLHATLKLLHNKRLKQFQDLYDPHLFDMHIIDSF